MKDRGALTTWRTPDGAGPATPLRSALDRLVAVGYGLGYDAIVRGFPPYESLLEEVAAYVAGARRPGAGPNDLKVLDVACGTGIVAARLGREGYRVVALDPVGHLVMVARRRHGGMPNVSFHHRDVARDPVPDAGTFDVVVSMHTLYWHPNPAGVLDACRQALRPGGRALFLTYTRPARVTRTFRELRTRQGLVAAVRALRWLLPTAAFEMFRHYEPQYLSREQLGDALLRAGFEVQDLRETFLAELSLLAWVRTPMTPPVRLSR
jgi:demethylmenaquinone methyltransferase/2-methoxy-6-polyprenyl-1,4-benzoquinol methylase